MTVFTMTVTDSQCVAMSSRTVKDSIHLFADTTMYLWHHVLDGATTRDVALCIQIFQRLYPVNLCFTGRSHPWVLSDQGIAIPDDFHCVLLQALVMRKHVQKHKGGCSYVTFSPSGNYLATGGHDGIVRIWNAGDGSLLTELLPPTAHNAASINCVQFSEDKGIVMAASNDKSISVWDFHTGRQRFTMTGLNMPISFLDNTF